MSTVESQPERQMRVANSLRIDAARLRSEVKRGLVRASAALDDPRAGVLWVEQLALAIPRVGQLTAATAVGRAGIRTSAGFADGRRRVSELTEGQRVAFARELDLLQRRKAA